MNLLNKHWLDSQPKRMSSAAMILENAAGQALIVKANYKKYWTFPGGIIDLDEAPKAGAIREVYEEVGLEIDPASVEFVAVVYRRSDYAQTYQFIFKSRLSDSTISQIRLQTAEIEACNLVTKAQVKSGDRNYSKALMSWVAGTTGYIEQAFL